MSRVVIDQEKCIGCETCTEICPFNLLSMAGAAVQVSHEEECMTCGHCVAVCPVEAITHKELDPAGFLPVPGSLPIPSEGLYSFLRSRRSCRVYAKKEVPREALEKLVDIARYAPTGHNRQNFAFIVVQNKEEVERISHRAARFFRDLVKEVEASPEPGFLKKMLYELRMDYESSLQGKDRIFRGAPVVILVHAPTDVSSSVDNCLYALFHIALMAETLGLGTCLNRRFLLATDRNPEIARELGIPADHKLFGCVTVGYPKYKFRRMPPRNSPRVKWI